MKRPGGRLPAAADSDSSGYCLWALWQPLHDPPIFLSPAATPSASSLSAALATAAVFSLYSSVSFFQLSLEPFSGSFLPSASPNAFRSLASLLASSHFPALTSAPIPLRRPFDPCPFFMISLIDGVFSLSSAW